MEGVADRILGGWRKTIIATFDLRPNFSNTNKQHEIEEGEGNI